MSDAGDARSAWPTAMLALLERQNDLVEQLANLATRQSDLIDRADTDALLTLLTQRQDLIQAFTACQTELGELTDGLDTKLEAVSDDQRDSIRGLIDAIGRRLGEVMTNDERDQRTLESARGRARDRLGEVDAVRQARQAYLNKRKMDTRFADRKG